MAQELTVTGFCNGSKQVMIDGYVIAGIYVSRRGPKWTVAVTSYHHLYTCRGPAIRGTDGGIGADIFRTPAGPCPEDLAARIMARRAEVLKISA